MTPGDISIFKLKKPRESKVDQRLHIIRRGSTTYCNKSTTSFNGTKDTAVANASYEYIKGIIDKHNFSICWECADKCHETICYWEK